MSGSLVSIERRPDRPGWYMRWTDPRTGKRRKRKCESATKRGAREEAAPLEAKLRRESYIQSTGADPGITPDANWPIRDALVMFAEHQRTKPKPVSDGWIAMTRSHITRACEACGWVVVGSINAPAARQHLARLRAEQGLGEAALNRHRAALRAFSRWLASEDGANLPTDPLRDLKPYNEKAAPRRNRRALTEAEKKRLLEQAAKSDVVTIQKPYRHKGKLTTCKRNITIPHRATLYRLALTTGLRASELASLRPSSFDLDSEKPSVRVEGEHTKNRETVRQPLKQDMVAELRELLASEPGTVRLDVWLWPDLKRAAEVLRADCEAAGIQAETAEGRIDFHSLRHTFVTDLARAGVHPKVAQRLARHSTVQLTLDVYTHAGDDELHDALARV